MHDNEIELVVETKDSGKSPIHLSARGRIQSAEVGSHNVEVTTVPLGDACDVTAQGCVGWTIRQEKGTSHQS
jgi:hypothetical protein